MTTLKTACIAIFAAASLTAPAQAAAPASQRAETYAIARQFMRMQYELHDMKGAKSRFYSPDFIQHNQEIKNGVLGDQDFIEARQKREPDKYLPVEQWTNVIDHLLVQDKYFAIHHHVYAHPNDKGRVFMDIWRVENGKMVEHWDVIQPVNTAPLNGNTMWKDGVKAKPPGPGEPLPETIIRNYLRIGQDQGDARRAAELYIADRFVQHSPHIADGKRALIAYFAKRQAEAKPGAAKRISSVSHMVADGDLVLVTRHVMQAVGDKGSMYADLFRVQGGKIVEHWDVIQAVPEVSVNGNSMW
jgi:predicted SnoaL-like aldol condensation-catalyzing enzyme